MVPDAVNEAFCGCTIWVRAAVALFMPECGHGSAGKPCTHVLVGPCTAGVHRCINAVKVDVHVHNETITIGSPCGLISFTDSWKSCASGEGLQSCAASSAWMRCSRVGTKKWHCVLTK